jgi:hypothetical protein
MDTGDTRSIDVLEVISDHNNIQDFETCKYETGWLYHPAIK